MKTRPFLTTLLLSFIGCAASTDPEDRTSHAAQATRATNEVVVMGMIHRGHLDSGPFDVEKLKALIKRIEPDYVLTEIPPDRFDAAASEFESTGKISEPRVRAFPEYTEALFPLTLEMDFEIVPCAGWTREMADARRAKLQVLRSSRPEESNEVAEAQARAAARIAAAGDPDDPVTIHTDRYDTLVGEGMAPYDRHFNELLGPGGWSNINAAHYSHIEAALDAHSGEGKRFLVTFGAWHKNDFQTRLRERDDIDLIPMSSFLAASHPTPMEWPEFRGNRNRTGAYGRTEIKTPALLWEFDTGDVIESSPTVVQDTVFIGGHSGHLHALDRSTGRLRWTFPVGGLLRATPSVEGGKVYFGADDNVFYAVDALSGRKLWDFALGEGGEQSSPAIVDGAVYFGAFDHHVYALDAATGSLRWKRDVGSGVLSSPTVHGDVLYIGTNGGNVMALGTQNGEPRWTARASEEPVFSSPLVADGRVYFSSYDGSIYSLDATTGEVVWRSPTGAACFSSSALDGSTLFVGSNDDHLYALDARSGELRWRTDLQGAVFSSPCVTEGSIYVGSSDGNLYALERNGDVRWSYSVGEGVNVWTSPVASQGRLYFGSHAGKVVVLTDGR